MSAMPLPAEVKFSALAAPRETPSCVCASSTTSSFKYAIPPRASREFCYDMGGDLHPISARANSLELLDRISGAEFLNDARPVIAARTRQRGRDDRRVQVFHEEGSGDDAGENSWIHAARFCIPSQGTPKVNHSSPFPPFGHTTMSASAIVFSLDER